MANDKNQTAEEGKIRENITRWVEAVRAKDVGKIIPLYARDVLVFDLAPPLTHRGIDVYRKGWEEWLATFEGPVDIHIQDLKINLSVDVAFTHSLNRMVGTKKSG